MEQIDTIEQFDPIHAPIYNSPKYISLFFDYDDASLPEIKTQVESILIEFGPKIGWRTAIDAIRPLETHLINQVFAKIGTESIEYLREKELGGKQNRKERLDIETLLKMSEELN